MRSDSYCGEIQKRRGAGGGTADPAGAGIGFDVGAGIGCDVGAGIGFDVGAGAGVGINMTPRAPAMMPRMTMNHMPSAAQRNAFIAVAARR